MKNIIIVLTLFHSLVCTGIGNPLITRESDEAVVKFLAQDSRMLVDEHGDLLLNFLLYRPAASITQDADPGSTMRPVIKKDDYPVVTVLIKGRERTLNLIENTLFFDIQVHPQDLEIISYILFRLLGKQGALEFAEKKVRLGDQSKIVAQNWSAMIEYLRNPENSTGRFFTQKFDTAAEASEYSKSYLTYKEKRRGARDEN